MNRIPVWNNEADVFTK